MSFATSLDIDFAALPVFPDSCYLVVDDPASHNFLREVNIEVGLQDPYKPYLVYENRVGSLKLKSGEKLTPLKISGMVGLDPEAIIVADIKFSGDNNCGMKFSSDDAGWSVSGLAPLVSETTTCPMQVSYTNDNGASIKADAEITVLPAQLSMDLSSEDTSFNFYQL